METLNCFKTYDIRGVVPTELNPDLAYKIGRAYASFLNPKTVVVGHDIRLTGPEITEALSKGLTDSGVNVVHIGECGTEEIYFAVPHLKADGGIMVTASHNPANYNGMKLVREHAIPIGQDSGLNDIKQRILDDNFKPLNPIGTTSAKNIRADYCKKLLSFVDKDKIRPLKVVVNPGNGGAGAIIDALESQLPVNFIKVHFEPNGHFPNGVPNPLLPENRKASQQAVVEHKADLGVAWDGDFDRCFFFDGQGNFIEGYYLVGLLASYFIAQSPNDKIIYDPRLYWNTEQTLQATGGVGVKSKTGHAFIKETMRSENAIYGGEMSAHHYFRDFFYCDNGNIPWLIICQLISETGKSLSTLIAEQVAAFPCSGEINLTVNDAAKVIASLEETYAKQALSIDKIDGLSLEFDDWRFNVRSSNTEPLLRLNVETKANTELLKQKTDELLKLIRSS